MIHTLEAKVLFNLPPPPRTDLLILPWGTPKILLVFKSCLLKSKTLSSCVWLLKASNNFYFSFLVASNCLIVNSNCFSVYFIFSFFFVNFSCNYIFSLDKADFWLATCIYNILSYFRSFSRLTSIDVTSAVDLSLLANKVSLIYFFSFYSFFNLRSKSSIWVF